MGGRGRSGVEQENGTGQPWNHALPIKLPVPRIPKGRISPSHFHGQNKPSEKKMRKVEKKPGKKK